MKKSKLVIKLLLVGLLALAVALAAGCSKKKAAVSEKPETATKTAPVSESGLKKVRVGYFGNTCEAPLFAAYEQGFFKEEGLDAELIKGDHTILKEGLATNKIDVTDGLLMQWIKPAEQGLNVRFTTGLHTGCIKILVPANSAIKSVNDLKGKRIGVPAIGGGPMNLVVRLLSSAGIDVKNGVTWRAFPNAELELALAKGEVDVITLADPLAQIIVNKGKARTLFDSAVDKPFSNEYCCLLVLNGKIVQEDPKTAAAITRAVMKGAKWVSENPEKTAKMEVERKYIPGDADVNAKILAHYNYMPSVEGGEQAVIAGSKELKASGILEPGTDPDALAKRIFVRLAGVQ